MGVSSLLSRGVTSSLSMLLLPHAPFVLPPQHRHLASVPTLLYPSTLLPTALVAALLLPTQPCCEPPYPLSVYTQLPLQRAAALPLPSPPPPHWFPPSPLLYSTSLLPSFSHLHLALATDFPLPFTHRSRLHLYLVDALLHSSLHSRGHRYGDMAQMLNRRRKRSAT